MTTTTPVMSITDEVLAELEAAADAATPGPWVSTGSAESDLERWVMTADQQWSIGSTHCGVEGFDCQEENATHISLNNPAMTKALLRHIAELKERCATAEKDARRYAWIRDQHNDGLSRTLVAVYQPGEWVSLGTFVSGEKSYVLNLDMAVDAAIQPQGEMT